MIKLYLVRHGESVINLNSKTFGSGSQGGLTHTGVDQAQKTGEWFKQENIHLDYFITSPYERAESTINIILKTLNFDINKVIIDPSLSEWNRGRYSAMPKSEACDLLGIKKRGDLGAWFNLEEGESIKLMQARFIIWMNEITNKYYKDDVSVLVITHGHFLKFGLMSIFNTPDNMQKLIKINNCGITRIDFVNNEWIPGMMNFTDHLD